MWQIKQAIVRCDCLQEREMFSSVRPICREAANGFEGVFEALTNQATGFAGGI